VIDIVDGAVRFYFYSYTAQWAKKSHKKYHNFENPFLGIYSPTGITWQRKLIS